jgi:GPH family glycoside/pentoside/hexuronide:cation symporter
LILAQVIFSTLTDPRQQYLVLGAVCAVLSVLPLYWCVWGTRDRVVAVESQRRDTQEPDESLPFLQQLRIVFNNRPFLYVIGIYLCSWLGVQVTAAIIPYFVVNCMGLEDKDVPTLIIAVQGTALVMLFVWSYISERVGKKAVYFMGMTLWIMAQAGLFFLQPEQLGLMYILAVMAGFGVSTAYLIPWSMMPDVIELDELKTGQRREGIFYGFMVLLQKFGLALGLFLVGNALDWSGFKETIAGQGIPEQPASALLAIRIAIGPLPTLCLIVGIVLAYFYPITREVHAEILLKLKERQRGDGAMG